MKGAAEPPLFLSQKLPCPLLPEIERKEQNAREEISLAQWGILRYP